MSFTYDTIFSSTISSLSNSLCDGTHVERLLRNRTLLRLIPQHTINLAHHPFIQLCDKLDRVQILLQLRRIRRAHNDRAHILIRDAPRERELRKSAAEALGDGAQLVGLVDLVGLGAELDVLEPGVLFEAEAAAGGDLALAVLAAQDAAREGGPDCGAVTELGVEGEVVVLDALALKHVV